MTDQDDINISSAVSDAGRAACLLQWGHLQIMLDPDQVLITARDLQAAAARAETDIALIRMLKARITTDLQVVGRMLADVRSERPMLPGKPALRIEAVAGAHTGQPYVHVGRGSMAGSMSPDEARTMAMNWVETAVAAHTDARLRYVLGEYDQLTPDDIAGIFTGLRRAGGDNTERHR